MLMWGDIMNVVIPHTKGDCIARSGVQIDYNGCNMKLTINYKKYIYHHSSIRFKDNLCPCPILLLTICHNTPAVIIPAPPEDDMA